MAATAATAASRLRAQIPHDRAARIAADALQSAGQGRPGASATEVQETRWRGASRALRSMQTWMAAIGSPTSDQSGSETRTMRARSRDALRNHLVARAALTRARTNIVGTGLMCRPAVDADLLGISPDAAEALNARLLALFSSWAESPIECDAEGALDFYGLQGLALLSAMASGDLFAITPQQRRAGGAWALKVQLIEADRVSNPHDADDTAARTGGVQIDGSSPVGYWIRDTHPGDRTGAMPRWQYYTAIGHRTGRRRVLHVWNDKERPGQVRGAPYLAPILEPLKQIERLTGAELAASVVSAMLTVFIEKDNEIFGPDGSHPAALPVDAGGNVRLGNAAVVDLGVGEKVKEVNPLRPNSNFDPFFVAIVKQIGAALEIPRDELLLHYDASYSAARAAMLQAWRFYTQRRWALTQQFAQPIYELWMDEAVARGLVSLPGYADPLRRRAYSTALWIGPARGAMDEEKEARAAAARIAAGISNETIETASMTGEDWPSVYAQRKREIDQRKRDGTYLVPRDSSGRALTDPEAAEGDADRPGDTGGTP